MPSQWGKDTVAKFYGGELHIRLSGSKAKDDYVKDLREIVARSENLQPALERVSQYLMGATLRNFEAQGRPKWRALKPATLADRARKGFPPGPILVRTRALRDSLTKPGAPHQVLKLGQRSVQLSSRLPYFRAHQFGTNNIPKRAMLVLQRQDRSQISRIINDYIRHGKITTGRL